MNQFMPQELKAGMIDQVVDILLVPSEAMVHANDFVAVV